MLLGLALGSRESYENWLAFGRDLAGRGLRSPALIIADGARPGPRASCGRPPRNSGAPFTRCAVTGKLPERHHRELKGRWWQVVDDAASDADARRGLHTAP